MGMEFSVYLRAREDVSLRAWVDYLARSGSAVQVLNPAALDSGRGFLPLKLLNFPLSENKAVDLASGFELYVHEAGPPGPQNPAPPGYGWAVSFYPRSWTERMFALMLAVYLLRRHEGVFFAPGQGCFGPEVAPALLEEIAALEEQARAEYRESKPNENVTYNQTYSRARLFLYGRYGASGRDITEHPVQLLVAVLAMLALAFALYKLNAWR